MEIVFDWFWEIKPKINLIICVYVSVCLGVCAVSKCMSGSPSHWIDSVSRVSAWLRLKRVHHMEILCTSRSRPVPHTATLGSGGQLRVWERCPEGRELEKSLSFSINFTYFCCSFWLNSFFVSSCVCFPTISSISFLFQISEDHKLLANLCGRKTQKELQSSVNPSLRSSSGGCLSITFHSDFSDTGKNAGFTAIYSTQGKAIKLLEITFKRCYK